MRSYIQKYRCKLDELRRIGGAATKGSLRRAFSALLERIADEHKLILVNEYPLRTRDGKDDLDREIEIKLGKGDLSDNILFEDTRSIEQVRALDQP